MRCSLQICQKNGASLPNGKLGLLLQIYKNSHFHSSELLVPTIITGMENNTNTQKIERATKTLPSGTCDSTLSLLSITGEGKRLGADALIVR